MMSRFSSGSMVASLKTGIDCGPVSMASYMWVGSTPAQVGRELAVGERAARADGVVAQAQLVRNSSHAVRRRRRRGRSGSTCSAVGIAGPGAERRDVRGELVDLLRGVRDRLAGACGSGCISGHPAGADLEVDGGGAHADQGRAGTCRARTALAAVRGSWRSRLRTASRPPRRRGLGRGGLRVGAAVGGEHRVQAPPKSSSASEAGRRAPRRGAAAGRRLHGRSRLSTWRSGCVISGPAT